MALDFPLFQKYRFLWTIFILLFCLSAEAQFTPRIGSAEPGNTPGPGTVGKHILQVQQGYRYSHLRLAEAEIYDETVGGVSFYDSLYGQRRHFQTNVIRYGILERLELRARINYTYNKHQAEGNGIFSTAPARNGVDFDLGLRANLVHKPDIGFDLGIQGDYGFIYPDLSNINGAAHQASGFLLVSQRLTEDFMLTLNGGVTYSNIQPEFFVGRASLRYFFGDYFVHIGYTREDAFSGVLENIGSNAYFVAIAYYLSDDVLLNVEGSFGNGFSGRYRNTEGLIQENILNVGLGLSWRLNFRN